MNSLWSQHRIAITLGATTFSLRSFVTGTFRFPTWFPKQNLLFRKEKRYLHRKRTLKLIHPLRRIDPCEFQSIGNSHPDRIVPKDIDFFPGEENQNPNWKPKSNPKSSILEPNSSLTSTVVSFEKAECRIIFVRTSTE